MKPEEIIVCVDPSVPGMSRVADALLGVPVLPRRKALIDQIRDSRENVADRRIAVVVPVERPLLLASARALGANRVFAFVSGFESPRRLRSSTIRSLLAFADGGLVFSKEAERLAIQLGVDSRRIYNLNHVSPQILLSEPPRVSSATGLAEAAVSLGLDFLAASHALSALERLGPAANGVNTVNYHRVLPSDELRNYGRPGMAMTDSLFFTQIDLLQRQRGVVPLERIDAPQAEGKVAITFDDGYEDNFRVAFPILQELSAPASIFVITQLVGNREAPWWDRLSFALFACFRAKEEIFFPDSIPRVANEILKTTSHFEAQDIVSRTIDALNDVTEPEKERAADDAVALVKELALTRTMMTWEEIEDMRDAGIDFGSHTKNHVVLDGLTKQKAEEELFGAQEELEAILKGRAKKMAALPRGRLGELEIKDLKDYGFERVMTTEPSVTTPGSTPFFLPRRDGGMLTLRGRHHPAKLRLELTGFLDNIRKRLGAS